MLQSTQEQVPEMVQRTLDALARNAMTPHYVATAAQVPALVESLLQPGDTVSLGGSMTLLACGIPELLCNGNYQYLDRYAEGLTRDELEALFRQVFTADAYITGSNAITEDGALVNVDGNANRVAAMAYGPKRVIVVAGVNKIVADEAAGFERIAQIAAPRNAQRLHCKTPCTETGVCQNCSSPARICCTYVVQRRQRVAGRIHVILVNETLGY